MVPWIPWCLKAVGGTLGGSMYFTTQLFQFGTPYFRVFIALFLDLLFPLAKTQLYITEYYSYKDLVKRTCSVRLPLSSCISLRWGITCDLLQSSFIRIGSVGRGGYGGGGTRRDSVNIYIKGVEIKKGFFCCSWLQKFLLAPLKIVWD